MTKTKDLEERTIEPAFTKIPKYGRKRIFGTETEFGTHIYSSFEGIFLSNGGRLYPDSGHVEYASPECSNPLEAVIYSKAGEKIARKRRKLHKNNRDSHGHTYGYHENYFTHASHSRLESMLPFLVTRQIFAGSGYFHDDISEIAQRSHFLNVTVSSNTQNSRGILCTKDENLSSVEGWHRLHLILGDANMCEIAEFLKLGTTGLVLDLVEDDLCPELHYSYGSAVRDIQLNAEKTSNWKLAGFGKATKAQRSYLKAAEKAYKGRDQITDALIDYWGFVLTQLDKDPMSLVGIVDWITKKALIDQAKEQGASQDVLDNINLQYHDVNPRGLFYTLQKQGKIARLVTDEMIEHAVNNPPEDTRAYLRGRMNKAGESVNWEYAHHIKTPDPFKSGKFSLERVESLNGQATAEDKEIEELLSEAPTSSIVERFWRVVYEHTGVLPPEGADDVRQLIDDPSVYVFSGDELIPEARSYAILTENRRMFGRYQYGGDIGMVPLGQKVRITNKVNDKKLVVNAEMADRSRRKWYVHPEEIGIKPIHKAFKAGYDASTHKRAFFNGFVWECREQLADDYKEIGDICLIQDIVSHDREAWQAYRNEKGKDSIADPKTLKRVRDALVPHGLEVQND